LRKTLWQAHPVKVCGAGIQPVCRQSGKSGEFGCRFYQFFRQRSRVNYPAMRNSGNDIDIFGSPVYQAKSDQSRATADNQLETFFSLKAYQVIKLNQYGIKILLI